MTEDDANPDGALPTDRPPRTSFMLAGALTNSEGTRYDIRIRNLSAGGLMADCAQPMIAGETVTVELRNIGRRSGRIAWAAPQRFGMVFDEPIDPDEARKPV